MPFFTFQPHSIACRILELQRHSRIQTDIRPFPHQPANGLPQVQVPWFAHASLTPSSTKFGVAEVA
jgi:hypothetical protein